MVGNNDAHGKNFSILYDDQGNTSFAPLYDILSTSYYTELSNKMAMKIGGEYAADRILPKHFEKLAEDTGLGRPMVLERISEIASKLLININNLSINNPTTTAIASLIKSRCERVAAWSC